MDPKARQEGENSRASGPARFGGLDQLDWLMIVLPFLLMVAGYRARRKVTELIESRRAKAKRPTGK